MVSNLMQFTFVVCLFSADDGMDKARMEKWLADGDDELIVQTFRRHPDDVLGFVDEYMEGGLKMIEEGKTEHEAMVSFRIGVKFGKLADKAFGETIFTEYTASFASWSPAERKRFREGQKEYRAGKAAMSEPAKALEHFEKSLKLAEPLGDHWGTAMALGGIADALAKLDRRNDAIEHADRAAFLNGRLRLRKAQIAAELVSLKASNWTLAERVTCLLRDDDEPSFRRSVVEECARALEQRGNKGQAEQLRTLLPKNEVASQPSKD